MQIAPPTKVYSRGILQPLRGEILIRYAAAYGCTLLSILAAQLHIADSLALMLAAITLAGLVVSLWLRFSNLQLGPVRVERPLLNSIVVVAALLAIVAHVMRTEPRLLAGDFRNVFMLYGEARSLIQLLMEIFLIFAAFRCFAIVTDKDAVWCAAPSFSVLLLLIVVDRGPAVVVYFLVWMLMAAVLFASDHYAESRAMSSGYVPSLVPGESATLSARSLGAVMLMSLACAIGLSFTLTSQDGGGRRSFELWLTGLASHLTQVALNLPEASGNSGPERQIDFSSGPGVPTRAELWQVGAMTSQGKTLQPFYWRMFTLSNYNGSSWSQFSGTGNAVPLQPLNEQQWPDWFSRMRSIANSEAPNFNPQSRRDARPAPSHAPPLPPVPGFDVQGHMKPRTLTDAQFGRPQIHVRQRVIPRVSNIGFIPTLPAVTALRVRRGGLEQIYVRNDNSINMGVLNVDQEVRLQSEVPPGEDYGNPEAMPPTRRGEKPNPSAQLSDAERKLYLNLPPIVPRRVIDYARATVHGAAQQASDYARAQRLATTLQNTGVYTLHPAVIPEGRDAVDYFLFESGRRGYCTYFASALTVLCRAVNIPARVVSGFANPEWEAEGEFAILREANAHAWTEVWVPGWGWATLDATPADDRGDNAPSWWENWIDLFASTTESARHWIGEHRIWLIALAPFLVGALIAFTIGRNGAVERRLRRLLPGRRERMKEDAMRRAVFDAYQRAARGVTRRFRRRTTWETPSEWLQAAEAVLYLTDSRPLHRLTALYVKAQYATGALSSAEVAAADAALASLSWQRRPGSPSRFPIVDWLRRLARRQAGAQHQPAK